MNLSIDKEQNISVLEREYNIIELYDTQLHGNN